MLYGADLCDSHLCRVAVPRLHESFDYGEVLVAHFVPFNFPDHVSLVLLPRRTASNRHRDGSFQLVHFCPQTGSEFLRRRGVEAGSSSRTREYENDVHDSRRDKEMFE